MPRFEIRDEYFLKKLKAGLFAHDPSKAKLAYLNAYRRCEYPDTPLYCTVLPMSECPKDEPVGICPDMKRVKEIIAKRRKDESRD